MLLYQLSECVYHIQGADFCIMGLETIEIGNDIQ